MNCKPGDVAIVIAPDTTTRNLGKLVHVVGTSPFGDGWWWVECLSRAHVYREDGGAGFIATCGNIEDHRLRPIRDHGDDARDETLGWLPVPTKESA